MCGSMAGYSGGLHKEDPMLTGTTHAFRDNSTTGASLATVHRLYAESRAPDLEAELLRRHERLALLLAMQMSHRGEPVDDLCQVARLAMLRALRNYDPNRGVQFSSYAVPAILGALKRHLRDRGWFVRPTRRVQESYLAVNSAIEDLRGELGREATTAELAAHCGITAEDVVESLAAGAGRRVVPLASVRSRHGDTEPEASLGDDGVSVAATEDHLLVAQLVARLPDAQREVITMSFFSGLTQAEIAARLGTSQSAVSRMRRRAIEDLRAVCRGEMSA
jgi:RNA polymerase sigma-B factor